MAGCQLKSSVIVVAGMVTLIPLSVPSAAGRWVTIRTGM